MVESEPQKLTAESSMNKSAERVEKKLLQSEDQNFIVKSEAKAVQREQSSMKDPLKLKVKQA